MLTVVVNRAMRPFPTFIVGVALLIGSSRGADIPKNADLVYVGTHTGEKSKGIYYFWLQTEGMEVPQNITLVPLGLAAETANPTFLEIDPKRRLLFAVNDVDQGSVSAFSIDPAGKLIPLNQRSSGGALPCHLILDKDSKNLLVANCGSGSVAVLPIGADGRLGEIAGSVQVGKKVDGLTLDPAGAFAFICDSGSDKILAFRYDAQSGKLTPGEPAFLSIKAGSGPRHMVFRPDSRFAYSINSKASTIDVFSYDSKTGGMQQVQTISSLPDSFTGESIAAEVGMHPLGKYLYASNNGDNNVTLFSIDPDKGTLTYLDEEDTGGRNPHHFAIQTSAKHVVIANQDSDSDSVWACRIDAPSGRLRPSGVFAAAPSPTCMKFLPPLESGH